MRLRLFVGQENTPQAILAALEPMQALFRCYDANGDPIQGCELGFRNTQAAFRGESVADELTALELSPLATLRPEAPGAVENLRKITPSNFDIVTFQFDPPTALPAGLSALEASLRLDGSTEDVFTDIQGLGTLECLDDQFGTIGVGDSCFNPDTLERVTAFRLTLAGRPADGRYTFTVRATDEVGQVGDESVLEFKIDRRPPTVPAVTGALGTDLAFTNSTSPILEWNRSTDDLTPFDGIEYDAEIDLTRGFPAPVATNTLKGADFPEDPVSWEVENEQVDGEYTTLMPGVVYWWRSRAVDNSGVLPAGPLGALEEGDEPPDGSQGPLGLGPLQADREVVRLPGRGNASDFSEPIRFIIDIEPPTDVTGLRSTSLGGNTTNDNRPNIEWGRSTDPGFVAVGDPRSVGSGVDSYRVLVTNQLTGVGPAAFIVSDSDTERCNPDTGLCSLEIPTSLVDGPYLIEITALDRVANESIPIGIEVFVDTLAPNTPVILNAVAAGGENRFRVTWARSQDPGFTQNDPSNTGSGVGFYEVVVNPGNIAGTLQNLDATCPGNVCEFVSDVVLDGDYQIAVTAVDRATNRSDADAIERFIGDPGAPRNLIQIEDTRFSRTPSLQWKRPRNRDLGAGNPTDTYEIAVAPDVGGDPNFPDEEFIDVFNDPENLFDIQCFEEDGVTLINNCGANRDAAVVLQLTFNAENRLTSEDGNYHFGARVVDIGQNRNLVSILFAVDETPPEPTTNLQVDATAVVEDKPVKIDNRTPVFAWDASPGDNVSGVDHYQLTVVGTRSGYDQTFTTEGLETTFQIPNTVETILLDDEYTAEVRAVDVAGNIEGTATLDFAVDLLPPTDPAVSKDGDDDSDRTPSFTITASEDAGVGVAHYPVHVGSVRVTDVPEPPGVSVILSPGQGAEIFDDTPTAQWSRVAGEGVTYSFELGAGELAGTDPFENPVFSRSTVVDEVPATPDVIDFSIPSADFLDPGQYTLHVRAISGLGNAGEFSAPRTFTVVLPSVEPTELETPAMVFPPDRSTGGVTTPTFEFTQVDADVDLSYVLEIEPISGNKPVTGGFAQPVFSQANIPDLLVRSNGELVIQFTLPEDSALEPGTYSWHVEAVDILGNRSGFSRPFFTLTIGEDSEAPAAPGLVSPIGDAEITNPRPAFAWNPASDPSGVTYELQVSTESGENFESSVHFFKVDGLTNPNFTPTEDIDRLFPAEDRDPHQFVWRVRARDGAGNDGEFSAEGIFFLDSRPPIVPTDLREDLEVLDPALRGTDYTPVFQWEFDPAVVQYQLLLDGVLEGTTDDIDTETVPGLARFALAAPITFGIARQFQVRASDEFGNVSTATLFFIDTTVDPTDVNDDGDIVYTVPDQDSLLLGSYRIEVAAVDRLVPVLPDLESKRAHQSARAIESFDVAEMVVSLLPATQSRRLPGQRTATVTVNIDPRGLSVDSVQVLIDYGTQLSLDPANVTALEGEGIEVDDI